MSVCACVSVCPSPNVEPKPIDRSRSKSVSKVLLENISSRFFSFPLNPKIKGSSHKKKIKISIFSKMAPTIVFKFCVFIVHSKPNNMTLSVFPGKILETRKIVLNFLFVT